MQVTIIKYKKYRIEKYQEKPKYRTEAYRGFWLYSNSLKGIKWSITTEIKCKEEKCVKFLDEWIPSFVRILTRVRHADNLIQKINKGKSHD